MPLGEWRGLDNLLAPLLIKLRSLDRLRVMVCGLPPRGQIGGCFECGFGITATRIRL